MNITTLSEPWWPKSDHAWFNAFGLPCSPGAEDFKRTSDALDTPEPSATRTQAQRASAAFR